MGTYSQLIKKPQSAKKTETSPTPEPQVKETTNDSKLARKNASKLASKKASKLAISQFTEEDIADLRQSTYKQLNVRGTEDEAEWLRDTAYQLSKAVKRGKVDQADIIRVGIRLFQKFLESSKADLVEVLEKMN